MVKVGVEVEVRVAVEAPAGKVVALLPGEARRLSL